MNKLNMQLKVTTSFKIIIFLMVLFSFYIMLSFDYNVAYFSYFNSLIMSIYNIYSILVLFLSMLYFTVDTIHNFDIKYMQIIRYKNYKEYINKLMVKVSINNLLIFMIYIILLMSLFYFRYITINISDYIYYHVPDILYFCFTIFKTYLILNVLILIIVLLIKYLKNIYSYILSLFLIVENIFFSNNNDIITLKNIIWSPFQFLSQYNFANFKIEVLSNIIFIFSIIVILLILKKILNKKKIDIG